MTLTELRARVRRLTGIRMTTLLSDTDIDQVLNEVYAQLLGVTDWPFLYTTGQVATVAGQANVAIPAPLRTVSSVVVVGTDVHERLTQVTVDTIDDAEDTEDGVPTVYAQVSPTTIILHPTPDAAYTVEYRGHEAKPALTAGDAPVFADEFHPAVAYGAAARILAEEGDDSGRIEAYNGEVSIALSTMDQRYSRIHDRGSFQMGGRRSPRRSL